MRNKLNARATTIDGIYFPSTLEAKRYTQLKLLLASGDISDLELHPQFNIIITSLIYPDERKQVAKYHADFKYFDKAKDSVVIEDVKGRMTEAAALRIKIVEALYGIEIVIVTKKDM
jgi:hypothetical protein